MAALTLFVQNLPASASSEHLEEIFSEVGPVKRCFVVRDKGSETCRGFGYVTYCMAEDAQRALREIKYYEDKKIIVIQAKKKLYEKKQGKMKKAEVKTERAEVKTESPEVKTESPEEPSEVKSQPKSQGMRKNKMKARLIIRNLSFKCSEADLKEVFSKYGTVLDAKIPLKPDGKKRGFAFVQFKNIQEAGKALKATNLKEIKDRQVAVDWAVSKDKYVANQLSSASGGKKVTEADDEDVKPVEKQSKSQPEESSHSESEAGSSSDDDDDDEEDHSKDSEDEEHDDSESLEADSDASDDEDTDEDDDKEENAKKKKPKKLLPSDVNEGRTIFIRNLSFNSEEEDIEEVLLQFGELAYVRIVVHPETGHSKGYAFAQFKTKEAAEKCLAAAAQTESETGGVWVDGRKLSIVLAVTREDASKLKNKKVKTHTGSRNLYLAREGLIRAGTKAAEGVSEFDMAKRERLAELRRAKLKDVNVFVSQTRLCIQNLPESVDNKGLHKLCMLAAGGGKGVRIKECRVMYDRKPVRGEPMGRSLGYGFVEFQEHEHALQALRHLNNNPKIFKANKRPIVEFSLEDKRKLQLKAWREQKSKMTSAAYPGAGKKQVNRFGTLEGTSKQPQQKSPKKPSAAVQQSEEFQKGGKKIQGVLSSHYSGFRTTPEVEHVELGDGKKRQKILPMPSRIGPKIRKRDKGKQNAQVRKVKTIPSRKERKGVLSMEKPSPNKKQNAKPAKRKFQNREHDHFDRLVEQYKKKLTGTSNSNESLVKKSKWFS
ncbi:RNA-binding protein 28 [Ictalurus furcatus]|uniref:RNA-binding protein 28 n=1 Tax=Ictalurus furcatus TaxID=66913 RepID=UPI00234FC2C6|nr:RNA-binding protein 28 [Ictalurus furcatus]